MKRTYPTPRLLAAAAAGALILTGCFREEASSTTQAQGAGTTLEGRVEGDMALAKRAMGGGVEGAVISVTRIGSDGSIKVVSENEVKTDAQGRFVVKAAADGARELIVKAKKEGKEWRAIVSAKAEKGKTILCRPVNLESSLEADVLLKVRGEAKDREVVFADIASKIDAGFTMQVEAKGDAKASIHAYLAAQARAEAEARSKALVSGTVKATLAQIEKAHEARLDAQAKLEADLHAAADLSAEAKAKLEADFHKAELKAWTDAGIAIGTLSAARESCFTAMIKGGAQVAVDAEAKLAWLRRISLEHADRVEIAVEEHAKANGGTAIQLQGAAAAGLALEASLKAVRTEAGIDSAFATFKSACAALRLAVPGEGKIVLPGFTLTGKVEGNVSGADVQVAKVKADGSLEIVAGVSGKTDAQGGFTLSGEADLPDSVVVVVTHEESKLMVFVDSTVRSPVQVGAETTLEAKLIQQIAKDGKAEIITSGEVKAHVDSAVTAGVDGSDSALAKVITGLELAAKAQGKLILSAGLAAEDSLVAKARSLELYAQVLAKSTLDLSAEARFALVKGAHVTACKALRVAAEAQARAAGASDASVKVLAEAGAKLQASVEASVNAEAIAAAYETYHAAVTLSLKSALVLHASLVEKADAAIRAQDGARAKLIAKLKAAADPDAAAKAQVEFAAEVEAEVKAALGSGLGAPSAAQVNAVAHALVIANMNG